MQFTNQLKPNRLRRYHTLNNKKEILLGDNPFFGIDHLSQERARNRMKVLTGSEKISEVMEFVSDMGVRGFVVSTHPQLKFLIKHMKENTNLLEKFDFYPILPYAQGYVAKVSQKGIKNTIGDIISTGSTQSKLKIILKGSAGFIRKDFDKLFQTFIDVELLPLSGVRKKVVFLHNVVTDLAIGLGMKKVIDNFINHIEKQYGVEAGLVTINFAKLVKTLEEWNIKIPTIMTSFNSIGYQMNPSKKECEDYLHKTNVIAMNVLAGGYLKPPEAFEYISKIGINSVVIGMSNKEHAQDTIEAFNRYIKI